MVVYIVKHILRGRDLVISYKVISSPKFVCVRVSVTILFTRESE